MATEVIRRTIDNDHDLRSRDGTNATMIHVFDGQTVKVVTNRLVLVVFRKWNVDNFTVNGQHPNRFSRSHHSISFLVNRQGEWVIANEGKYPIQVVVIARTSLPTNIVLIIKDKE